MGGGNWDPSVYASTTMRNVQAGTSFAYTSAVQTGAISAGVHDMLDPQKVAGPTSPLAGEIVREARDNAEHPLSVPIYVSFDQTGSMGEVPRVLQTKLGDLFTLLLDKGYVVDPQLGVGAYGDAKALTQFGVGEVAPLQVSQFESDNKADETLENLYLEGHGHGNGGESAALTWYYLAFHTATDAWEKRGKRGYAFTVGDEITHGITEEEVRHYIHGGNQDVTLPFKGRMTPAEVVAAVQEKWDLHHLIIDNSSAKLQGSERFYTQLLGDNAIILEDPRGVAETIALIIGMKEDAIDLDDGLDDLRALGSTSTGAVGKALAKQGAGRSGGGVAVSQAPADLDEDDEDLTRI